MEKSSNRLPSPADQRGTIISDFGRTDQKGRANRSQPERDTDPDKITSISIRAPNPTWHHQVLPAQLTSSFYPRRGKPDSSMHAQWSVARTFRSLPFCPCAILTSAYADAELEYVSTLQALHSHQSVSITVPMHIVRSHRTTFRSMT